MDSQSAFDPSLFPGISDTFDPLDNFGDPITFTDLALDDDPLFPADWDQQDLSPEGNLYSTPLSWDEPKIEHEPKIEPMLVNNYSTVNSLTASQQEKLRKIAMPSHLQYRGHNSPNSTTSGKSISSPETHDEHPDGNTRSRKRKSSASADEEEEDEDDDSNPPAKKTAHNMIEKRYRVNLNDKIAALRESVPSLRIMRKSQKGEDTADDRENLQGLQPAHKLNKATILAKATEYIQHLEKRNKKFESENKEQKARLNAFETLFRSGSMGFNSQPMPSYQFNPDYSTPGPSPIAEVQGLIPVPENMQRLHRQMPPGQPFAVPQQDYYPRQQVQQNGWNSNYMQKMMIGGLASLMVLEGWREAEQDVNSPAARGLFATPIHLIRGFISTIHNSAHVDVLGYHISSNQVFGYVKLFFCIGAILCLVLPSWFVEKPKSKPGKQASALVAAPSLASPIQVRRQAWLTAIQTVWVPRHNFFLELLALCSKSIKLSIRNVIGVYWYCRITQTTEQQEEARIKAWEIALDAQLAGGDVEVNKRRLALTLMASGTLPDTPARLMLKALHIRVLLLAAGTSGFNHIYLFQELAANLARVQWNKARLLHRLQANEKDSQEDRLPSYLAALLKLECDDVINNIIAQRAFNLTWNLDTTHESLEDIDGMDSVIDDFAIRSPLDAVAAWYSTLVLQGALASSLVASDSDTLVQKDIGHDIALAIKTAPFGSTAQSRALVARAIIVRQKRGLSIAESMRALGTDMKYNKNGEANNLVNTRTSMDTPSDIRMALSYAIAIAHLDRSPAPLSPETACQIISCIAPRPVSLLGFTAAYILMRKVEGHEVVRVACMGSLERLAGTLRIWVGSEEGRASGLDEVAKGKCVEVCVGISKGILSMDLVEDDGYESMPEEGEGKGC